MVNTKISEKIEILRVVEKYLKKLILMGFAVSIPNNAYQLRNLTNF